MILTYQAISFALIAAGIIITIGGLLTFALGHGPRSPLTPLLAAAVGAFVTIAGPALLPKVPPNAATKQSVTDTIKLAALANGTTTKSVSSGSFLASTTTTSQEPIFQYVRANTDGSYQLETITGSTRVKEDATVKNARIETTQCQYVDKDVRDKWGASCGDKVTTIHIPAGSIARNYSVDANKQ